MCGLRNCNVNCLNVLQNTTECNLIVSDSKFDCVINDNDRKIHDDDGNANSSGKLEMY